MVCFIVYDMCMGTFEIDHDIRPVQGNPKPRSKTVNIRFNNAEHKRVFATAYKQGKTVSEMIRHYIVICLDAFDTEFGEVNIEDKKSSVKPKQIVSDKEKPTTIEECIVSTLELDESRKSLGWDEKHRIIALNVQSQSSDVAMAQAAVIVFQQRKSEKAELSKDAK